MILSFRCAETQALFESGSSRRWASILNVATRKLTMLNAALSCATFAPHRATGWSSYRAIEQINTASESTINGESALCGLPLALHKSKSSITTEEVAT